MKWSGEDGHSVVEGKTVELIDIESGFVGGASVQCFLKEGNFPATIIATGRLLCIKRIWGSTLV